MKIYIKNKKLFIIMLISTGLSIYFYLKLTAYKNPPLFYKTTSAIEPNEIRNKVYNYFAEAHNFKKKINNLNSYYHRIFKSKHKDDFYYVQLIESLFFSFIKCKLLNGNLNPIETMCHNGNKIFSHNADFFDEQGNMYIVNMGTNYILKFNSDLTQFTKIGLQGFFKESSKLGIFQNDEYKHIDLNFYLKSRYINGNAKGLKKRIQSALLLFKSKYVKVENVSEIIDIDMDRNKNIYVVDRISNSIKKIKYNPAHDDMKEIDFATKEEYLDKFTIK